MDTFNEWNGREKTEQILEFYGSLNKAKSETMTQIFAIKEDLGAAGITQTNLAKHIQASVTEKSARRPEEFC